MEPRILRRLRILRALRLNLRRYEAYTLHIRLSKAAKDPEVFKDA